MDKSTSSPASEGGAWPVDSPDSPTISESSPQAFPASPRALPDPDSVTPTSDGSGRNSSDYFADWNPTTRSWSSPQASFLSMMGESGDGFLGPWPNSVRISNCRACPLKPWEPRKVASGFGSWPTPNAGAFNDTESPDSWQARHDLHATKEDATRSGLPLSIAAKSWATPTVDDANNITRNSGSVASLARDCHRWATPRAEDGERGQNSEFAGLPEDVKRWATPTTKGDHNYKGASPSLDDGLATEAQNWATPLAGNVDAATGGNHGGMALNDQASNWATPQTNYDGRSPDAWEKAKAEKKAKHAAGEYGAGTGTPGMMDLNRQAANWATPTSNDAKNSTMPPSQDKRDSLTTDVKQWATPQAHDSSPGDASRVGRFGTTAGGRNLNDEAQAFSVGPTPSPSEATTEASDSSPKTPLRVGLNHRFSLWLQGYPAWWLDIAASATRGVPKRRAQRSE